MALEAIRFNKVSGELSILNQLLLPETFEYELINSVEEGWSAIKKMKVIFVCLCVCCKLIACKLISVLVGV